MLSWKLLQWLPDGPPELRQQVAGWLGIRVDAPLPTLQVEGPVVRMVRSEGGPSPMVYATPALSSGTWTLSFDAQSDTSEIMDVGFGTERRTFEVTPYGKHVVLSAVLPYRTDDTTVLLWPKGVGTTEVRRLTIKPVAPFHLQTAPGVLSVNFPCPCPQRRAEQPAKRPSRLVYYSSADPGPHVLEWAPQVSIQADPGTWLEVEATWPDGRRYASPEVQIPGPPPSINMTHPGYRHVLFANDPDRTVRLTSQSPVQLQDASGKVLYQGAAGDIQYDASALPPGRYTWATAGPRATSPANTSLDMIVAPPLPEIIDVQRGTLRTNGVPFLPIGDYMRNPTFDDALDLGLNFAWVDWTEPHPVPAGMTVIPGHQLDLQQLPGALDTMVAQYRQTPVLAWTVVDEPDLSPYRRAVCESSYRHLIDIDPGHPLYTTNHSGDFDTLATVTDILAPDPYPIATVPRPIWSVATTIDRAVAAAGPNRCVMLVDQAFGLFPLWDRCPTGDEERCMTWLALNHGARGVIFYADLEIMWPGSPDLQWHLRQSPLWEPLKDIVAQLHRMEKVVVSTEPIRDPITLSDPDHCLDLGQWSLDGHTWAVVVNVTRSTVPVVLHAATSRLDVPEESRTVPVRDGTAKDSLRPLGVRIYRL